MRIASVALLTMFAALALSAQSGNAPAVDHSAHSGTLPIAVDGAKTPEKIPDYVAYRHFVMAVAERQNPSAQAADRRRVLLARVGLSQSDMDSLIAALVNVREQLDEIDAATAKLSTDSAESRTQLDNLRAQRNQILDDAATRSRNALTLDGWTRLDTYVREHVKRRIVIYGAQPQQ